MKYSVDFRKKVLKIRKDEGLSIEAVASRFGVGKASVMRWLVALEPKKSRNKPATKINMELLQEDILNHPDSFQYERAQRFGVSASGIALALQRLKVSYRNHPKADKEKRALFQEKINTYQKAKRPIVYLDESGFAHSMPRTSWLFA
ncbi:IS630 transposase-related protein [Legionella rubrilucens]|nr:IS630 transposase-related protein [Legionella rubrilucens]